MATAKELFGTAFSSANFRDARSRPYRDGVLASLRYWMGEAEHLSQPHDLGTAEADAWFYGTEEGARIARQHNAAQRGER